MKKAISLLLILSLALTIAACGMKEEKKSIDVSALYESYRQYLPEMFRPDESTMLSFLGIRVENCAQYQIAICSEGMRADEVWLIEAKDQASLESLRKLAQTRIEAKLDETKSYVPDQYVVVEKAELLTNGLYLALLISPDVDTLKAEFEAALR